MFIFSFFHYIVEITTLRVVDNNTGKLGIKILSNEEVEKLVQTFEAQQAQQAAAK